MRRLPQYLDFFFFNDTATTEIYTLSLHDALPIYEPSQRGHHDEGAEVIGRVGEVEAGRLGPGVFEVGSDALGRAGVRSEEHTSELQSQSNLVCRLLLEKKKRRHTEQQRQLR